MKLVKFEFWFELFFYFDKMKFIFVVLLSSFWSSKSERLTLQDGIKVATIIWATICLIPASLRSFYKHLFWTSKVSQLFYLLTLYINIYFYIFIEKNIILLVFYFTKNNNYSKYNYFLNLQSETSHTWIRTKCRLRLVASETFWPAGVSKIESRKTISVSGT